MAQRRIGWLVVSASLLLLAGCAKEPLEPTPEVQCVTAADCPGADGECGTRTCTGGVCGMTLAPALTACSAGSATMCDGNGACVACVSGDHCASGLCLSGWCAATCDDLVQDGSETDVDCGGSCAPCALGRGCAVASDCASGACADGACVECLAGAQCASGVCAGHVCAAPACDDLVRNGTESDVDCGGLACVACENGRACLAPEDCASGSCSGAVCASPGSGPLTVGPRDGAINVPTTTGYSLSSTVPMDSGTFVAQSSPGPCTGTFRVSLDGFETCAAVAGSGLWAGGGMSVSFGPLSVYTLAPGARYQVEVTAGLRSTSGAPLGPHTSTFTVAPDPSACQDPSPVVLGQVYTAGGAAGAPFANDYVELHNRGAAAVSLDGWSVQVSSGSSGSWQVVPLSGTIAPGGFHLLRLASGGSAGAALPAPDATSALALPDAGGAVALVQGASAITGVCPQDAGAVDGVRWSAGPLLPSGCASPSFSSPAATTALVRRSSGCFAFAAAAPTPRNATTAAALCPCAHGPVNETGVGAEADRCVLQAPATLDAAPGGTALVHGRLFEAGVTEPAGRAASVVAQLGIGPALTDPRSAAGWVFRPAGYGAQVGQDDEYAGTLTAPATPGSYAYAFRFSLDGGARWTYCDLDGAGSSAGADLDPANLGVLTVVAPP
jgi:hypothetical protein